MAQVQSTAQVVAFPTHLARPPVSEADVQPYELLAAYLENLKVQWGAQLYTSVGVQVRIARQLWGRWNSARGNDVLEKHPRFKEACQRFTALAYGLEIPANIRQPTQQEIDSMQQLISLQAKMAR